MGRAIRIIADDVVAAAELDDTRTASAIWAALPLEARAQTWGDEIYFGIGIRAEAEAASSSVPLRRVRATRFGPPARWRWSAGSSATPRCSRRSRRGPR